MTKMFALWIALVAFAGTAFAQAGTGSTADGSAAAATETPPASPPPAAPAAATSNARKACTDEMNSNPQFAAEIVQMADKGAAKKRDEDTLAAHLAATKQVEMNRRHVIYAYAAMWIVAAGFVLFLWRRQQGLKLEIAHLRRDLDTAAEDAASAKRRT